ESAIEPCRGGAAIRASASGSRSHVRVQNADRPVDGEGSTARVRESVFVASYYTHRARRTRRDNAWPSFASKRTMYTPLAAALPWSSRPSQVTQPSRSANEWLRDRSHTCRPHTS